METLAFYSYKGGIGRSLLLVNAARFLVSLGKGVVALDLDFEAPGLHYVFGRVASPEGVPERTGGAVPYLLATAQGAASPPPLEEHIFDVPVPPGSSGWLRLMPAGPAPERVYWTALKKLGEQVRFDDSSGQGLLTLLDLHARIADELKPDYLLIDVRPGVTELGGLATSVLADSVVCTFVANQESLDGTFIVAEALKAAPRLEGQRPVRIVPVLVRTKSEPLGEGSFAAGVKRLVALGEGGEGRGKERSPIVLKVQRPPGSHLRILAESIFSRQIYEMVFEPTLRDLLDEYIDALKDGKLGKVRWVRLRGYWSFWSAVLAQMPISTVKTIYKIWKVAR